MEKKATLIIKNIKTIYTNKELISYGYIAIHHDRIIGIGSADYESYIDKDTRILDGYNHIVVPAFIEPHAILPKFKTDVIRKETECLMEYMRNGTLSMYSVHTLHPQHDENYHYEVHRKRHENKRYPVFFGDALLKARHTIKNAQFCLSSSSYDDPIYDQLTYAQILYRKEGVAAQDVLKAVTLYPAKHLQITNVGSIEVGKQADLLVLSCATIDCLFSTFGNRSISQIIKKGVRIYPFLLI